MTKEYRNTKPDSPKGQVFTAFTKGGEEKARALAEKLEIAAFRVNKWLEDWRGSSPYKKVRPEDCTPNKGGPDGYDEPPPQTPPSPAAPKLSRKQARPAPQMGIERVFDVGEPNVHGTIIKHGEDVSTVKWDVPSPWGPTSHVGNENLRPALHEPSERDRFTAVHAKTFRVMRKDKLVDSFPTFNKAYAAAKDDMGLWVFAVSAGGGVSLLQRAHWAFYGALLNGKG